MVKDTNRKMLTDIRDRTIIIETHLKDMNGKLIKHDKFIEEKCPVRHDTLREEITGLKVTQAKILAFAFVVFSIIQILIKFYMGG